MSQLVSEVEAFVAREEARAEALADAAGADVIKIVAEAKADVEKIVALVEGHAASVKAVSSDDVQLRQRAQQERIDARIRQVNDGEVPEGALGKGEPANVEVVETHDDPVAEEHVEDEHAELAEGQSANDDVVASAPDVA